MASWPLCPARLTDPAQASCLRLVAAPDRTFASKETLMRKFSLLTAVVLSAFLLLCIGVQILITGVEDVLEPLLRQH